MSVDSSRGAGSMTGAEAADSAAWDPEIETGSATREKRARRTDMVVKLDGGLAGRGKRDHPSVPTFAVATCRAVAGQRVRLGRGRFGGTRTHQDGGALRRGAPGFYAAVANQSPVVV